MVGFIDGDYAGDQDDTKNTPGYVLVVLWSSKKQTIVTLSCAGKINLLLLQLLLIKLFGLGESCGPWKKKAH